MKSLPRLVGPVLLGFVLLAFLLPFVAVSCDVPGAGSFEADWTGVDLATGGDPSLETAGTDQPSPVEANESPPEPSVQVLAIITVVLVVAGLVVSLLPLARIRMLAVAGAAGLAGVLLVVTQSVAKSNLTSALLAEVNRQSSQRPTDSPPAITQSQIEEILGTRIGFWLALIGLILVLLFTIAVLVRDRPRAPRPPPAAP